MAGYHRVEGGIVTGGWQAQNVINLIRAKVVISVLAIHVVIIDIAPTHEEITPFYIPIGVK